MARQLLHLVFGGRLKEPNGTEFVDTGSLDIVGIYPNYRTAHEAWLGKARATIDDAETRYFIVHMHRLLDPSEQDDEKPQ
jgi:hypothetical protein